MAQRIDFTLLHLDLARVRAEEVKQRKLLDAKASFELLSHCLTYINMNDLEELNKVKKEIFEAMKKMKVIEKNGGR